MRWRRRGRWFWWLYVALLLMAGQCENPLRSFSEARSVEATATPSPEPAYQPLDLLDLVQQRGFLKVGVRVWPDANFQPSLYRSPLAGLDGYEVDVAWALADGLGVELEMAESDPRRLAGGNWEGEWDIALAWLPITDNAQQVLIFSIPYAYDTGRVAVHQDNQTITHFGALAGHKVGVPSLTIYQQILMGQSPSIEGEFISGPIPSGLEVVAYNRDGNTMRDLAEGDGVILDAVLHSGPVLETAIAAELPLKLLPEPNFRVPVGVAFDRGGLPAERLRLEINEILTRLHQEGTLASFSFDRYGYDISK